MLKYQSFMKKLYGTAATLIANKSFFMNSTCIMVHADNFTSLNLIDLIKAHQNRPSNCLFTMLTFETKNPSACGIVNVDIDGIVQNFYEKSSEYYGNLANGAIYLFEDTFLLWLLENCPTARDFSTEVIPNLTGKIFSFKTYQPFIDIGTKNFRKARSIAKNLK